MARLLMMVFILVMITQAAYGVSDPRPDVLGVYFDEYGDQICNDMVLIGVPFSVWFVYTNPTPTSILGFEAGFYTTGDSFVRLGMYPPCSIIWIPPDLDNLTLICSEPFATAEATPLFRIEYLYIGGGSPESTFYLENASGSSLPGNNPYIILADGSPLEVQAGYPAYTTYFCGVPVENMDWGTIKSLYR
jgi:hypothetical protein